MIVLVLAWRNLWRHKRRTLFTTAAIAITGAMVVFLPSLQSGSYSGMVDNFVNITDGYAQIQKPDYLESPSMRDSFSIGQDLRSQLEGLPKEIHFCERGIAYALLSSDKRSLGVEIMGVQPQKERMVSTIPGRIEKGDFLESGGQIVLGETLAGNLRISVGDSVTLLGLGRDGSLAADVLTVSGIFRTGTLEIDRQVAEMPLDRFDSTFSMDGERHAVVLNSDDHRLLGQAIDDLKPAVTSSGLAMRDWTELQPGLYSAIKLDLTTAIMLYAVLIAVVVVSLLNTILLSVLERTREFGMMMALGVKSGLLARVVWAEIGLLGLVGVVAGMAIGAVLTVSFAQNGIQFESAQAIFEQYGMSSTLYPQLTPLTLFLGPAVIIIVLCLTGLLPALRIHKLNLLKAMRSA